MKYIVTCDNLCYGTSSVARRGEQLDESDLRSAENIADLIEIGAIGPVEDAEVAEAAQPARKPLSRMNKAELLDVAAELGLEVDPEDTNANLIAAIETAEARPAEELEEELEEELVD